MYKLQRNIKQKIEELLASLEPTDLSSLRLKLDQLSTIEQPKKEQLISQLHEQVSSIVPPDHLQKYRRLQQKMKSNNHTLQIVSRGRIVCCKLSQYLELQKIELQKGRTILLEVIDALNQFQELSSCAFPDFNCLREQLYTQLLVKVNHSQQQFTNHFPQFRTELETINLPLKKGEVRTEPPPESHKHKLLSMMHRQNCLITLQKQLNSLLEKEEEGSKSSLLQFFWEPSVKTVIYLFATGSELHNLEQPGWMLQYLQLVLNSNYKYFQDCLLGDDLRQEVSKALNGYFLEGSVDCFFMKAIEARLELDMKHLNAFLSFNFLDQISSFQFKLYSSFGLRACLLEKLLIKYGNLLDSSFQYENQRFQTKIFEDFISINYSQVNLKNLEPYNLMSAFLTMLQRLQGKYTFVTYPPLTKRIAKFYRERVMVLVAHLKTSFDRIYHHSRLPKLDVLVSFKRTEQQLRSSLSKFTLNDPQLQQNLQKEYYCFLEQYYESAALQALTPVHKKIHISLGDIINKLQSPDESNHDIMLQGFAKIQQQWISKMDQISKFSSYVDTKLRGIFFTYLEALQFSSVGLNLYLKIFQPFLQVIFMEERHRTLISLITVDREKYQQFRQSQPASLSFLSQSQLSKLGEFKKKMP